MDELRSILAGPGAGTKLSDEEIRSLIADFDTNGDGVLDIEECVNAFGSIQSRLTPRARAVANPQAKQTPRVVNLSPIQLTDTTVVALPGYDHVRRALTAFDDRLVEVLAAAVIHLVRSAWLLAQPAGFQMPYWQELEALERSGTSPSPLVSPADAVALVRQGNRGVGTVTQ